MQEKDTGSRDVLVVMGSVRDGRICERIARWVIAIGTSATTLPCELIDLRDWSLPMTDEPAIPARGIYAQEHTRAWSRKIAQGDAFVFVTPQYNWGYPAALKNAIDHLYAEWHDKPALLVSYGGHGGSKCAAQLRQVTEAVKMRAVATMPQIVLTQAMIESATVDPERELLAHVPDIRAGFADLIAALG